MTEACSDHERIAATLAVASEFGQQIDQDLGVAQQQPDAVLVVVDPDRGVALERDLEGSSTQAALRGAQAGCRGGQPGILIKRRQAQGWMAHGYRV